ncbi:ATP-binding cassette domain-containing protein [Paenibacillus sp. LMG 31456]|uniref:ATP-binding cassette domain-containing protein n=1 Tax=Paenibacillus foliorum TaxID=2654974 RepID=A0A972GZF6_9BACL|nr:ABC transporter ATP-binding protein [Paenibacillus foliorum]NOU95715.1 ATP-binding cassette domain-containing protein [Paenibacillus foliorum]
MKSLLDIRNISIHFKGDHEKVNVVHDISLQVNPGEIVGIVGESGCGKSVTSMSILRLLGRNAEVKGEIFFDGRNLLEISEKEMRKLRGNGISMIFQEPMTSLNPLHTIGKQIGEPLLRHRNMSKSDRKSRVLKLLNEVGIPRAEEIYEEFPHQLSGGMRQRVMIAVALACDPALIIADEPTTALDVTIQAQILELMKNISRQHQTSILFITHDLGVVAEMCDRVIVMYAGQIVEHADVAALFRKPKHPYTVGLLNSIPDMAADKERLVPIKGHVPSLRNMPSGCRFFERCDHAMDICRQEPRMFADGTHECRCWLHADEEGRP